MTRAQGCPGSLASLSGRELTFDGVAIAERATQSAHFAQHQYSVLECRCAQRIWAMPRSLQARGSDAFGPKMAKRLEAIVRSKA